MMRFNEFKFKNILNDIGACVIWENFNYKIEHEDHRIISIRFELCEYDTFFSYGISIYKDKEAHIASHSINIELDSNNDFYDEIYDEIARDRVILHEAIKDSLEEVLPEAVEVEPIGEIEVEWNEDI